MKILQVVSFFKPSWEAGGTVRVCYEISKKLLEKGHLITVYTTDGFKYRLKVKKNTPVFVDNMPVYYFRNVSNLLARKNICIPYFLPYIAKKEIKNFDIIHMHTFRGPISIPVWYYAKNYHIPYIIQPHGSLQTIGKRRLKKFYDKVLGYRILKEASRVIALTKTEANQYRRMGVNEDKIEIIPNGVNLSEYKNLPKRGKFRKKYSIEGENIILYLGRIHKSKGIDLLVKAFSDLIKELKHTKLVIIGPDDGYAIELVNLMQKLHLGDKVIFLGFVDHKEKLAALVDADIFVTPSFYGFPVTFLEAMACGTPIITTNKGDELDWIDDKIGYVVKYDKDQLKNAIYSILSDDKLRRKFGDEGKKLIREVFNWEKIVEHLEKVYHKTLEETK